jgi:hypothetical protein
MPLAQNLQIAQAAIAHVAGLGIRSSNKGSHRLAAVGGADNAVGSDMGTRTGNLGPAGLNLVAVRTTPVANLRQLAQTAVAAQAGNCGELAVIVAVEMFDNGGTPIHLMNFSATGYDHAWATIGVHNGWDPADLRSWGDEAVWVDPWQTESGIAFPIKDFIAGKVRNLNWLFNCDTVERVEAGGIQGNQVG